MAYGAKYRILFDTLDGVHSYDIRLKKKDYVGSTTVVEGPAPPWTLFYGSKNKDPNDPTLESTAELRVYDGSRAILDEIYGASEDEWIMDVDRDSADFWDGFVKTDLAERSTDSLDFVAVIRAVCGIKVSEGKRFDNAGTLYSGRTEISKGAVKAFQKVGATLGVTEHRFASGWYPYHPDTPITGDPWAAVRFSQEWMATEKGVAYSANRVIREIGNRFLSRAMQVDGKWWLVQPRISHTASYLAYGYDETGAASSNEVVSAVDITTVGSVSPANGIEVEKGGNIAGEPAYRSASIKYTHAVREDLFVKNGGFEDTTGSDPDLWTASVAGAGISFDEGYDSLKSLSFDPVLPSATLKADIWNAGKYREQTLGWILSGSSLQFSAKVRSKKENVEQEIFARDLRSRPMFFSLYGTSLDGDQYWWDDDAREWKQAGFVTDFIARVEAYVHTWAGVKRIIDEPPEALKIRLRLYGGVDMIDIGTSEYEIDRFLWDDVKIDVVGASEQAVAARQTTLTNTETTNSAHKELEDVILGDGPSENHISRLTILDGTDDVPTTGWRHGVYPGAEASTGNNIDRILIESVLIDRREPVKRVDLEVDLDGSADYLPNAAFTYDGDNYVCVYYRLDAYRRKIQVVGVQVRASGSITLDSVIDLDVSPSSLNANTLVEIRDGIEVKAADDIFAITTQAYAAGTTISSLAVEPLTEGVGKGRYLVVLPPDGGFVMAKTSASAAAGDTSVPVEDLYVDNTLRYPAGVRVSNYTIYSALRVTEEAITAVVSGTPTTTAAQARSGTYSTLLIDPLPYPIKDGTKMTVSPSGGGDFVLTLSQDHETGDTTLFFDSETFTIAIGDPIYAQGITTEGSVSVQAARIDQVIKRIGEQIGTVGANYSGSITTIDIDNLTTPLANGDTILAQNIATGTLYELDVAGDYAAGSSVSVTILSANVELDSGDPVLPGQIVAFRLAFDGITAQAPLISSSNFNGTYDGNWNITSAGTTGWAMTKQGDASFNNVFSRGVITIQSGSSGVTNLSDAGALATEDDADGIPPGVTYRVPTDLQIGNLDTAGDFSGVVYPLSAATTIASGNGPGLYMGSDYLGYYNSGWKVYIQNNGEFFFGTDAGNHIQYDGASFQGVFAGSGVIVDAGGLGIHMNSSFTEPFVITYDPGGGSVDVLAIRHVSVSGDDIAQLVNPAGIVQFGALTSVGGETSATFTMYPSGSDSPFDWDDPLADIQGVLGTDRQLSGQMFWNVFVADESKQIDGADTPDADGFISMIPAGVTAGSTSVVAGAQELYSVGTETIVRVRTAGRYIMDGDTTVRFKLELAGTVIFDTGDIVLASTGGDFYGFDADFEIVFSSGTAGRLYGRFFFEGGLTSGDQMIGHALQRVTNASSFSGLTGTVDVDLRVEWVSGNAASDLLRPALFSIDQARNGNA